MGESLYILFHPNYSDGYYEIKDENGFIENIDISELTQIRNLYQKEGYEFFVYKT